MISKLGKEKGVFSTLYTIRCSTVRHPSPGGNAFASGESGVNLSSASDTTSSRLSVFLFQHGRARAAAHAGRYATFWLEPVTLVEMRGFRDHELSEIGQIVADNRELFLGRWYEYFGGTN
jgi:hypothetical protein